MTLTPNALRVLEARYLRRDDHGRPAETPPQLFERVARAVAQAELNWAPPSESEKWAERFLALLTTLRFLPNSPTLMNAGTPLGQLSACFVLPVEDSMESIFGALRDMALVQRTGGGTGFSFSRLRPEGDIVASTGGTASGPVSFMKIFDCATENIKQGGRRRGANMGVLRVDHPDIEAFIDAKRDGTALQNFNLSVGATDEFMAAVESNSTLALRHPRDGHPVRTIPAAPLFEKICHAAWATGDPGLVFLDTINRANPTPAAGLFESTNPCGEVPLLPYESCNLGSLNLPAFLSGPDIDWPALASAIADAVRFLDDVITVNRYPVEAIANITQANRKIGLGIMGFAEACILLGIPYFSEDALRFADRLMRFIAHTAQTASANLARQRGVFPNWDRSTWKQQNLPLRNATLTSIAPTGTISIIAGTTSGIEPLFALAYRRAHVLADETLVVLNPIFLRALEQRGFASQPILDAVLHEGRLPDSLSLPPDFRALFTTALEIPPEFHVRVQAAFQAHVDNAVSKTVNLPAAATPAEVARLYRLAHRLGCKGITVFRYGSRSEQVLLLGAGEEPYKYEHFAHCDPNACRL